MCCTFLYNDNDPSLFDDFYLCHCLGYFFRKCNILFHLDMILILLLLIVTFFFFKINYFFVSSLKEVQNLFTQSFPQYKVCLSSISSNPQIAGIEYPQLICLLIFIVEQFSGLFTHPSIFLINDSRSA